MSLCHCFALLKGPRYRHKKAIEGALYGCKSVFLRACVGFCLAKLFLRCVRQWFKYNGLLGVSVGSPLCICIPDPCGKLHYKNLLAWRCRCAVWWVLSSSSGPVGDKSEAEWKIQADRQTWPEHAHTHTPPGAVFEVGLRKSTLPLRCGVYVSNCHTDAHRLFPIGAFAWQSVRWLTPRSASFCNSRVYYNSKPLMREQIPVIHLHWINNGLCMPVETYQEYFTLWYIYLYI